MNNREFVDYIYNIVEEKGGDMMVMMSEKMCLMVDIDIDNIYRIIIINLGNQKYCIRYYYFDNPLLQRRQRNRVPDAQFDATSYRGVFAVIDYISDYMMGPPMDSY